MTADDVLEVEGQARVMAVYDRQTPRHSWQIYTTRLEGQVTEKELREFAQRYAAKHRAQYPKFQVGVVYYDPAQQQEPIPCVLRCNAQVEVLS